MKRGLALGALGALVQFAACNCGSPTKGTPGKDAGPPPITAQNVCSDLASRACDFFTRCHSEPTLSYDFGEGRAVTLGESNDQVAASESDRCQAKISQSEQCEIFSSSVDAGRLSLDSAGYDSCMNLLYPSSTCIRDLSQILASGCENLPFLVGEVDAGSLCDSDQECTTGLYCTAANQDTCGLCQPHADAGLAAPCSRDSQCDLALEYCASGSCSAFIGTGQPCPLPTTTGYDPSECGVGNFVCAISNPFPPSGQCQPAKLLSEPCTVNNFECQFGSSGLPELVCGPAVNDAGTIQNLCVPVMAQPGGACGDGDTIPLVGPSFPICPETQYCSDNLCVDRLGASVACNSTSQCADGLFCSSVGGSKSCQPFQDSQATCGADSDCKNLLICPSGTCAPELSLTTEPCGQRSCVEGYCGGDQTCVAYGSVGDDCSSASQCRSNQCNTTCQSSCW